NHKPSQVKTDLKFTPVGGKPGWEVAEINGDWEELSEHAKTLNKTRPAQTYFVCGCLPQDSPPHLYRIQTSSPLEIIEAFQVGNHDLEALPAVLDQMAEVHARNPIIPFFADDAGLQCTFENPLTNDFCAFLDE